MEFDLTHKRGASSPSPLHRMSPLATSVIVAELVALSQEKGTASTPAPGYDDSFPGVGLKTVVHPGQVPLGLDTSSAPRVCKRGAGLDSYARIAPGYEVCYCTLIHRHNLFLLTL